MMSRSVASMKLEETGDGDSKWVEARASDDAAADRWTRRHDKDAAE